VGFRCLKAVTDETLLPVRVYLGSMIVLHCLEMYTHILCAQ
jgi:hypothetical protein